MRKDMARRPQRRVWPDDLDDIGEQVRAFVSVTVLALLLLAVALLSGGPSL